MVTRDDTALLSLEGISKVFPNGTQALHDASLLVRPGRINGLVGANGAGKSTLIKILSGAVKPSRGRVRWRGKQVSWHGPAGAQAVGIATVHQHTPLVPSLSVLDNVFLPRGGALRRESTRRQELAQVLDRFGYRIDMDQLVGDLSVGQRQMVAILQAINGGARLLVLDEPTASLAHEEREIVFSVVRRIAHNELAGVIYVSHLLDEVLELTDEVTVLRDGEVVLERDTANLDEDTLVRAIVGHAVAKTPPRPPQQASDESLLQVAGLRPHGRGAGLSFAVRAGEVVGVAGLLGSGRSSMLHAVFGADRRARGTVRVAGRPIRRSPASAIRHGVALVPEDRSKQGLVGDWEIWRNVTLPDLPRLALWKAVPRIYREQARASSAQRELDIKAASLDTPVSQLSGGNAQKVVFAKWTLDTTKVLLLDEPTVGVDIGAKEQILAAVRRFAAAGQAVVVVSAEFDELLRVSDRILVMWRGQIVAERPARDTSEEELLGLASGLGPGREGRTAS